MALLDNTVLDAALDIIRNSCENLYICSTAPTTFTEASSTYAVGSKAVTSTEIQDCADRTGGGRMIEIDAITDGSVSATHAAADFWALTDDSASLLLAAGDLSAPQAVTNGNTFTLAAFEIGLGDPT